MQQVGQGAPLVRRHPRQQGVHRPTAAPPLGASHHPVANLAGAEAQRAARTALEQDRPIPKRPCQRAAVASDERDLDGRVCGARGTGSRHGNLHHDVATRLAPMRKLRGQEFGDGRANSEDGGSHRRIVHFDLLNVHAFLSRRGRRQGEGKD